MPIIKLESASLSSIRRQIERMENETDAAQNKVLSALNGLDFEVSSKRNIQSRLSRINRALEKQSQSAVGTRNAFTKATNNIIETDGKFGSESNSIFDKIRSVVESNTGTIREFFIKNKMSKISKTSGLFMIQKPLTTWSVIVAHLQKIALWISGMFFSAASAEGSNNSNNSNNNSSSNTNVNTQPETDGIPDTMKKYPGSSKDYSKNGYGDYTVVKGFDEKYVISQMDYDLYTSTGSNGGCTSTADAIVGSIKNSPENVYNPEDDWPGPGNGGAQWTHTESLGNPGTAEEQKAEIYKQLNNGNAVVIRVRRSSSDYGHSMVAIGLKNGCDPNNLSSQDILLADPGSGKVITLAEYEAKSNGRTLYTRYEGWGLRIAKQNK